MNKNSSKYKRYKIVLLGNSNVGKSAVTMRYINKNYQDVYHTTIGCSFMAKILEKNDSKYSLDIWDTAGQERYQSILPMYYRNCNAVLLCFDTSVSMALNIKFINYWLKEIDEHSDNKDRAIILVGTKVDLVGDEMLLNIRRVIKSHFENIIYFNTSAKTNYGISEMFDKILDICIENTYETNNLQIDNIVIESKSRYNWCNII